MIIGYPPPDDEELDMPGARDAANATDCADTSAPRWRKPLPAEVEAESDADVTHLE